MQKVTKKELRVFIPIMCAAILNLLATFVDMSDYLQGLLQGIGIMLLIMSCIYLFPVFSQQKEKTSKSIEHGNN